MSGNAKCGSSSVGRATASQAVGRGFEPRLPLKISKGFSVELESLLFYLHTKHEILKDGGLIGGGAAGGHMRLISAMNYAALLRLLSIPLAICPALYSIQSQMTATKDSPSSRKAWIISSVLIPSRRCDYHVRTCFITEVVNYY